MKWKKYVPLWVEKYETGVSATSIANEFKTHHLTVIYWLKKEGIEIRPCSYSGPKNRTWKGHEDITGQFWSTIRLNARKRNIAFKITIEQVWELFLKQDKKCALTNLPLVISPTRKIETTASLDRIDSTKIYTIDNVQWVHKIVQSMKHCFSQEQYIQICYDVTKIHPEPIIRPNLKRPTRQKF